MSKIKFGNLPMIYPIPSILVGVVSGGKINYTTLGNCGIVSVEPSVIYISSVKTHFANKGIKENGVFSINIPSIDLVKELDYCGLVSGNEEDKSDVFESFFGSTDKAPMINACPINLECKVINEVDVFDMELFIGQVLNVYVNQDVMSNGFPDMKKVNPVIYGMDNMYWDIGKSIGTGFSEGKEYKKV